MQGAKHPFTNAIYERDDDGNIKVTETTGAWGIFTIKGQWLSGEVRECDPQLCGWVGGPRVANHRVGSGKPS